MQYCFGSKDALIDAMFDRWGKVYEQVFDDIAGSDPDPLTIVQAHMQATRSSDQASSAKAAGLMATLIQTPEHLDSTREWYRSRIAGLDLTTEAGRKARLAFLATEEPSCCGSSALWISLSRNGKQCLPICKVGSYRYGSQWLTYHTDRWRSLRVASMFSE